MSVWKEANAEAVKPAFSKWPKETDCVKWANEPASYTQFMLQWEIYIIA